MPVMLFVAGRCGGIFSQKYVDELHHRYMPSSSSFEVSTTPPWLDGKSLQEAFISFVFRNIKQC